MSDELIHHMRGFAEECLRRIELNPEVSGNELHTKQTYVDIMKLCDRVPASPQSDQLGPNVYRGDDGVDRVLGISSGSLPQSDQPCELHRKLNCQWMTCQAAPASQPSVPEPITEMRMC